MVIYQFYFLFSFWNALSKRKNLKINYKIYFMGLIILLMVDGTYTHWVKMVHYWHAPGVMVMKHLPLLLGEVF